MAEMNDNGTKFNAKVLFGRTEVRRTSVNTKREGLLASLLGLTPAVDAKALRLKSAAHKAPARPPRINPPQKTQRDIPVCEAVAAAPPAVPVVEAQPAPVVETYEAPVVDALEASVVVAPEIPIEEPVQAPALEDTVVEATVVEAPVLESPILEVPVLEVPALEATVVETPVVETPIVVAPEASAAIIIPEPIVVPEPNVILEPAVVLEPAIVPAPVVNPEPTITPASTRSNEERRKSPRRRMLKAALLNFNNTFSGLQCTVRDLSNGGARLKIDHLASLPDVFEFVIEIDGLYAKSRVAWRKASEAGIRFIEPVRTGAKIRAQVITPRT